MSHIRIAGASLAVLGLLIAGSSLAQEAEFFRLSTGTATAFAPPVDSNDDDEEGVPAAVSLSYPLVTAAPGETVTVSPVYQAPAGELYFYWSGTEPDGASIDEDTGVITWILGTEGGTHRAAVQMETEDSKFANADLDVDVTSTYKIDVDPTSLTFQQGNPNIVRAFLASLDGTPSTNDAEEWFLRKSYGFPDMEDTASPSAVLDTGAIYADGGDAYAGHYWFQFGRRDASGETVLSDAVSLVITEPPEIAYTSDGLTASGPGYRVDYDSIIQIVPGTNIQIQSVLSEGAVGSPASWPAWLDASLTNLPPGLSIAPDGDIVGTTTASVGEIFEDIAIPVISSEGAYNTRWVDFYVVSATTNVEDIPNGPWSGGPGGGDPGNPDSDGDGLNDDVDPDPFSYTQTFYWDFNQFALPPANGHYFTANDAWQAGMDIGISTGHDPDGDEDYCEHVFIYEYNYGMWNSFTIC